MKTQNFYNKPLKMLSSILVIGLLLNSCGKSNTVNSNQVAGTAAANQVYTNPAISAAWAQAKQRYACISPGARTELTLTTANNPVAAQPKFGNTYNYGTQGNSYNPFGNVITGTLRVGSTPGTHGESFLGGSIATGNLVAIDKITTGAQTSYNITLSLCPLVDQFSRTNIMANASQNQFSIDNVTGIVLQASQKAYGDILGGTIYMTTKYSYNPLPISFTVLQ